MGRKWDPSCKQYETPPRHTSGTEGGEGESIKGYWILTEATLPANWNRTSPSEASDHRSLLLNCRSVQLQLVHSQRDRHQYRPWTW